MSEASKDIVESYMDSLLDLPADDSTREVPRNATPTSIKPQMTIRPKKVKVAPLAEAISELEDVCKLEEERKEQLQALLTKQTLSQKPKSRSITTESPKPESSSITTKPPKPETTSNLLASSPQNSVAKKTISSDRELKIPEPWCDNGRPEWAQNSFSALLFKVSGLTLAVPLVSLGQIHPITQEITPIFGQAKWFMGLQDTPNGRIRTVNTSLYVMPERYQEGFVDSAKYVVSIEGLPWGLAVDQVQQPTLINPEDVTWRTERGKRPWLAGTVKSAMCALLDIPQLGYELEKSQS